MIGIELSCIEFCCRCGTLLSARSTNTITNNVSADVSSNDGHSNNLQPKLRSTNNVSADVSPIDEQSNIHSDGGTNRSTIVNGNTIINAIGCSNICHNNINAIIGFAFSGTNSSTIGGTNRSTITSAIGSSNNCETSINAIIGFAISGTNSSTIGGTNGSTIIGAISSSNISTDN
jgi:hypothetical protein